MWTYIYIYICLYIHIYICTNVCIYVYIFACQKEPIWSLICTNIHIYIYTYQYIHTYIHTTYNYTYIHTFSQRLTFQDALCILNKWVPVVKPNLKRVYIHIFDKISHASCGFLLVWHVPHRRAVNLYFVKAFSPERHDFFVSLLLDSADQKLREPAVFRGVEHGSEAVEKFNFRSPILLLRVLQLIGQRTARIRIKIQFPGRGMQ